MACFRRIALYIETSKPSVSAALVRGRSACFRSLSTRTGTACSGRTWVRLMKLFIRLTQESQKHVQWSRRNRLRCQGIVSRWWALHVTDRSCSSMFLSHHQSQGWQRKMPTYPVILLRRPGRESTVEQHGGNQMRAHVTVCCTSPAYTNHQAPIQRNKTCRCLASAH